MAGERHIYYIMFGFELPPLVYSSIIFEERNAFPTNFFSVKHSIQNEVSIIHSPFYHITQKSDRACVYLIHSSQDGSKMYHGPKKWIKLTLTACCDIRQKRVQSQALLTERRQVRYLSCIRSLMYVLGMIHRARKETGRKQTTVFGISTVSYTSSFFQIGQRRLLAN